MLRKVSLSGLLWGAAAAVVAYLLVSPSAIGWILLGMILGAMAAAAVMAQRSRPSAPAASYVDVKQRGHDEKQFCHRSCSRADGGNRDWFLYRPFLDMVAHRAGACDCRIGLAQTAQSAVQISSRLRIGAAKPGTHQEGMQKLAAN